MALSGYNLRNRSSNPSELAQSQGYQPPEGFSMQDANVQQVSATLDAITPMIDKLKPETDFEIGISNVVRLLIAQMKDIKQEHYNFQQMTARSLRHQDKQADDLALVVLKNEQYSRRDTVTVAGVAKSEGETAASLSRKVAENLSVSGENVQPSDFSAIHRNSQSSRSFGGKTFPPSITVRFMSVNKKDTVLRGYKNFDSIAMKPRDVKVYQSLSPHYSSELRGSIVKFFDPKSDDNHEQNFGMSRMGKLLKWVTYQSPTAGFAVKLKTDMCGRTLPNCSLVQLVR